MEKKNAIRLAYIAAGTVAFDLLFWKNHLGLNILLFTVIILLITFVLNPQKLGNRNALNTSILTIISSMLYLINNSTFSLVTYIISVVIMTGFILQDELKFITSSMITGLWNYILSSIKPFRDIFNLKGSSEKTRRRRTKIKFIAIPLAIFLVFFFIFKLANPVFNDYTKELANIIGERFATFFKDFSFGHLLFILFGITIVSGFIYNSGVKFFAKKDSTKADNISRDTIKSKGIKKKFKKLGLKDEAGIALIVLVSVNVLIAIVNAIDISWLWINFEFSEEMNLSQLVHEGTYLLILSILLSMGIVLYYFRANLNFYRNNKLIKYGAYIWIIQNIVMVISVAIRNFHYISYYGLAYKRIGVIFFLMLTIFGLISIIIKIRKQKSGSFLFKINTWAVYIVFVLISAFSWDTIIASHNINHKYQENIDVRFLLTLSDKTLHIINDNRDKINDNSAGKYNKYINKRIKSFTERKKSKSWVSWNFAEEKTYDALTGK